MVVLALRPTRPPPEPPSKNHPPSTPPPKKSSPLGLHKCLGVLPEFRCRRRLRIHEPSLAGGARDVGDSARRLSQRWTFRGYLVRTTRGEVGPRVTPTSATPSRLRGGPPPSTRLSPDPRALSVSQGPFPEVYMDTLYRGLLRRRARPLPSVHTLRGTCPSGLSSPPQRPGPTVPGGLSDRDVSQTSSSVLPRRGHRRGSGRRSSPP